MIIHAVTPPRDATQWNLDFVCGFRVEGLIELESPRGCCGEPQKALLEFAVLDWVR